MEKNAKRGLLAMLILWLGTAIALGVFAYLYYKHPQCKTGGRHGRLM